MVLLQNIIIILDEILDEVFLLLMFTCEYTVAS